MQTSRRRGRGNAGHGWLKGCHSFAFTGYRDPAGAAESP